MLFAMIGKSVIGKTTIIFNSCKGCGGGKGERVNCDVL